MKPRKVIITGASSGIGLGITDYLLEQGHQVIALAEAFPEQPARRGLETVEVDLAGLENLPTVLARLEARHADTDTVICCAGAGHFHELEDFSYDLIRQQMDINFTAHAFLLKTFLPHMKQRQAGDIILMGSQSGLKGHRRGSIYCASKFALRGLAQSLRDETSDAGIRISLINPGMVSTGFFDRSDFSHGEEAANYLTVEDVVDAVRLMLTSPTRGVFDEINLTPMQTVIRKKDPAG